MSVCVLANESTHFNALKMFKERDEEAKFLLAEKFLICLVEMSERGVEKVAIASLRLVMNISLCPNYLSKIYFHSLRAPTTKPVISLVHHHCRKCLFFCHFLKQHILAFDENEQKKFQFYLASLRGG
jgi:hypothetical protein